MAGIKLKQLDRGINGAVPYDEVADGDAVPGSINCLYCDGQIQTPDGFTVITANGLPLESGEEVLAVFKYTEQDRTEHLLAMTKSKVYRRDISQDTWVEIEKGSGSVPPEWGLSSNIDHPISWDIMDSTDGALLDETGSTFAYRHLLMSDGGQTSVKRWAGKYETKRWPLIGGGGYHADSGPSTIHYARQVGVFLNHVFLLNPKEYDSSGILRDTYSRIRWGMAGKLAWDGVGSDPSDNSAYNPLQVGAGYRDLINTGDQNQRAEKLGNSLIVYQKRTIWTGIGVSGSSDALSFDVTFDKRGLLAYNLLASDGARHYFIGSDNNLWAYYGGQQFELIEGRIGEELRNAMDATQAYRCFMCLGANHRRLWIFVIGIDEPYSVKAYGLDLRSKSWQIRDYSTLGTGKGIASANLIGGQSYMAGPSYQDLLDDTAAEDYYYYPTEIPLNETPTATTWSEATPGSGVYNKMTNASGLWKTGANKVKPGDIVWITAGTNVAAKEYAVLSVTSNTVMTLKAGVQSGGVPSNVTYTIRALPTATYFEELYEVLASDMLVIGASDGYIYQHDGALIADNGAAITAQHLTKVFDFDTPNEFKTWPGILIKAKGDSVQVSFRIGDFDTLTTGWVDFPPQTLTEVLTDYTFYIHQAAQAIQFKFESTGAFQISKAFILPPELEGVA